MQTIKHWAKPTLVVLLYIGILLSVLYPQLMHQTIWTVFCFVLYVGVFFIFLLILRKMPLLLFIFLALTATPILLLYAQTKDFVPMLFGLDDRPEYYTIHRFDTYYSLVYNHPGEISRAGFIGSSIYPLEKYVDKKISFKAEWRKTWGTPMCSTDPCQQISHAAVIDIKEIRLE